MTAGIAAIVAGPAVVLAIVTPTIRVVAAAAIVVTTMPVTAVVPAAVAAMTAMAATGTVAAITTVIVAAPIAALVSEGDRCQGCESQSASGTDACKN
jgi:hypothetical protein